VATYGSLFAGVGGFDMGFDQSGYECRFQVEWDKHCQQILQRHWPDVPKWWDVSEVNGAELPPVDVLIFGSPCQDLSVAGKRAGLSGERSVLFHEAIRIIKEMRNETGNTFPRVVVWENVAGALTSNGGADFGVVLDQMAEAGALVIEWALLDAQYFGVPQRRRRVFLVAVLDPAAAERCPDPLLPVTPGVRGNPKKGSKTRQGATDTTAVSFGKSSFGGWEEVEVAIPLSARDTKGPLTTVVETVPGPTAYSIREDAKAGNFSATELDHANSLSALIPSPQSHHAQMFIVDDAPLSFDTQFGSNANVFHDLSPTLKSSQQQPSVLQQSEAEENAAVQPFVKARRSQSVNNPESWVPGEVAPTLSQFDMGDIRTTVAVVEPTNIQGSMIVRRLSPVECERLMGWDDDHTRWRADGKEQTDTHRLRQCGNGVATPVARWVAQKIYPVLQSTN